MDSISVLLENTNRKYNHDMQEIIELYIDNDIYSESVILDVFDKMIRVTFTYMKLIQNLVVSTYQKNKYKSMLKSVGKVLKKYPHISSTKIVLPRNSDNLFDDLDRITLFITDKELYEIIHKYQDYATSTSSETIKSMRISKLYEKCLDGISIYESNIKTIQKDLLSIRRIIKRSKSTDIGIAKWFSNFCTFIKRLTNVEYNRVFKNYDMLVKGVGNCVYNTIDNYSKRYVEKTANALKSYKELEGTYGKLTYHDTIEIGKYKARIYSSNRKDMTAINYKGNIIVVEKGFFDQPIDVQEAILYHEIGHYMNGDFGKDKPGVNNISSEADMQKFVRKFKKSFDKEVNKSIYRDIIHDTYDNELIYLMVEVKADRYSAERIGKKKLSSTLKSRFDTYIDNDPNLTDAEKDYNKEYMNIRTRLI